MIQAITSPLRSKKIHIGMDEAHGVSEGRYRQLFGHKDSCQVVRFFFPWDFFHYNHRSQMMIISWFLGTTPSSRIIWIGWIRSAPRWGYGLWSGLIVSLFLFSLLFFGLMFVNFQLKKQHAIKCCSVLPRRTIRWVGTTTLAPQSPQNWCNLSHQKSSSSIGYLLFSFLFS